MSERKRQTGVIERYLYKTQGNAQALFQKVYPNDWRFFYDDWKKTGSEPNRARAYCETELSRMVIQELRRGHVRPH